MTPLILPDFITLRIGDPIMQKTLISWFVWMFIQINIFSLSHNLRAQLFYLFIHCIVNLNSFSQSHDYSRTCCINARYNLSPITID